MLMTKSFPKQMAMRVSSYGYKLKIVKTKNRNRLADESMTNQLRCATTKLSVDFKKLGYDIQKCHIEVVE